MAERVASAPTGGWRVTPGVKSVYLARRHPTLTREDFVARWRQHGALAMRLPLWRHASRYSHGDAIPATAGLAARLALSAEDFYGVGMVWFHGGEPALRALVEEPSFRELLEDEPEAFGDYVNDVTLLTQELTARDDGDVGARLLAFLALGGGDAAQRRWDELRDALAGDAQLRRLVVNRAIWPPAAEADGGPLPHHERRSSLEGIDGVLELGFGDLDELAGFCARHGIEGASPFGAERAIALVTNEVVLYPASDR